MTDIRIGTKAFYDNQKFARGFSKSGHFSKLESERLSLYGDTLFSLEQGTVEPQNAAEKHFLKVLANPGKAQTPLEHLWLKYIKLARGRKCFHTLNSYKKAAANDRHLTNVASIVDNNEDDFEPNEHQEYEIQSAS